MSDEREYFFGHMSYRLISIPKAYSNKYKHLFYILMRFTFFTKHEHTHFTIRNIYVHVHTSSWQEDFRDSIYCKSSIK